MWARFINSFINSKRSTWKRRKNTINTPYKQKKRTSKQRSEMSKKWEWIECDSEMKHRLTVYVCALWQSFHIPGWTGSENMESIEYTKWAVYKWWSNVISNFIRIWYSDDANEIISGDVGFRLLSVCRVWSSVKIANKYWKISPGQLVFKPQSFCFPG